MSATTMSRIETVSLASMRPKRLGDIVFGYWAALRLPALPTNGDLYIPVDQTGEISPTTVRWAARLAFTPNTAKSYATDVLLFFRYLEAEFPGIAWQCADAEICEAFFALRLAQHVAPGTNRRNREGLASFYRAALADGAVSIDPTPARGFNAGRGGGKSAANWLTRRAFDRWERIGVRGLGGPSQELIENSDRNSAYFRLLLGTGMRMAEGASFLTLELPRTGQVRPASPPLRGRIPAMSSKGSPQVGRLFYPSQEDLRLLDKYIGGPRELSIQDGIRRGLYEHDEDALIVDEIVNAGTLPSSLRVRQASHGRSVTVKLDNLDSESRRHVYFIDRNGNRRPYYLWLTSRGAPMKARSWHYVVRAANTRMQRLDRLERDNPDHASLRVNIHMLRHSFALHAFARHAITELHRTSSLDQKSLRSFTRQDSAWIKVMILLGHANVETTRQIYAAPALTLDFLWHIEAAATDGRTDVEVVEAIARIDQRVRDSIA